MEESGRRSHSIAPWSTAPYETGGAYATAADRRVVVAIVAEPTTRVPS